MSAIAVVRTGTDGGTATLLHAAMMAALAVYGPHGRHSDGSGEVALGRCLFRSVPEDEFDGQPVWSADKSCCLVADVRLDNRPDLVRELSIVHPEELSDSEILISAWQRWGASCLDRLLGGFAFAVWTPAQRELFVARDHTGERPLFYYRAGDLFAAASMPGGLLALPGVSGEFDERFASTWLAGLPPDEYTSFFRGIERLPAGHYLRVTPSSVERKRYWHPADAAPTRYKRDEEYAEALVDLLDRAVAARLRTSQPVGAFLSSGLDSSSVVASAALSLGRENRGLTAFTSVPRPSFDGACPPGYLPHEALGAAEVASMYPNIEHTVVDSRGYDLVPTMRKWIDVLDEPLANVTNLLWFNAITDKARERNITVMLEGAEGNGTLSWYSWSILGHFFTRGRWLKLASTAHALRGHGALSYKTAARYALRPIIPKSLTRRIIRKQNLVGLFDRLLQPERMERYGIANRIFDSIYHRPVDVKLEQSLLFNIYDRGPFRAATQALTGIELRDPTADKRIYEFCLSIPPEQYVVEGHSRSLARRAMKGRIPESIRLRYTRGLQSADWQIPLTEALPDIQQELRLEEQSAAVHEALDMPEIQRLLEAWPTGGFDKPEVFRRWNFALLPALSLGYFLRTHEVAANAMTSPAGVAVQ